MGPGTGGSEDWWIQGLVGMGTGGYRDWWMVGSGWIKGGGYRVWWIKGTVDPRSNGYRVVDPGMVMKGEVAPGCVSIAGDPGVVDSGNSGSGVWWVQGSMGSRVWWNEGPVKSGTGGFREQ